MTQRAYHATCRHGCGQRCGNVPGHPDFVAVLTAITNYRSDRGYDDRRCPGGRALHCLERGAKTGEGAIEWLQSYLPRYAQVAKLAGMEAEFAAITTVNVVEHHPGTGSTDFWGISFAFSGIDRQDLSSEKLERELTLVQACWAFFDDVRLRVSAQMQKGPRGGGRDRDHIVGHTIRVEQEWAEKVGVPTPQGALLIDEGLQAHRDTYRNAIRAFHAAGKTARTWPIRYLIRHTAYHTLDHAWEMEDKDLTGRGRSD